MLLLSPLTVEIESIVVSIYILFLFRSTVSGVVWSGCYPDPVKHQLDVNHQPHVTLSLHHHHHHHHHGIQPQFRIPIGSRVYQLSSFFLSLLLPRISFDFYASRGFQSRRHCNEQQHRQTFDAFPTAQKVPPTEFPCPRVSDVAYFAN